MSLLFNALFRFVIAFLPRSKDLLILGLQSLSTVILEPKKIKSITVFTFSPYICHEVMVPDAASVIFHSENIYSFSDSLQNELVLSLNNPTMPGRSGL